MVSWRQVRKSGNSYLSTPLMRSIKHCNLNSLAIILPAHLDNGFLQKLTSVSVRSRSQMVALLDGCEELVARVQPYLCSRVGGRRPPRC